MKKFEISKKNISPGSAVDMAQRAPSRAVLRAEALHLYRNILRALPRLGDTAAQNYYYNFARNVRVHIQHNTLFSGSGSEVLGRTLPTDHVQNPSFS